MNLEEKPTTERPFTFTGRDGLSLFCRYFDYPPSDPRTSAPSPARPPEKTPVLCLPGLTRNSKDFIALARRYGDRRRFVCPDFRGRGLSDWDPDYTRYHPGTYVEDMWELLARLGIGRVIIVGTSLGGIMALIMANARPEAVAGIVLNDIGPAVDPEGHARVSAYVGLLPEVGDWREAVSQVKEVYEIALPDLDDGRWLEYTRCQYREDESGVPRLEYDPAIGKALREVGGVPPDLWTLFGNLGELPVLALRGAISDILSRETFDRMAAVKPGLRRAIIPNRGHVPLLDEPECLSAMDGFLGVAMKVRDF